MAIFGDKGLNSIQGNVATRAIKMADIYVRSNTSDSGQVTDPAVYQNAIATYLAPYSNNPTIKDKIAEYVNNSKQIATKNLDQNVTLTKFKQGLDSALFYKQDAARDPYKLAQATATTLNGALAGLDSQIAYLDSQDKSTDALLSYRTKLASAAQQQNSLVNGLAQGTVNPQQDGFGYFMKTNPVDGSLLGVALLPSDVGGLTDSVGNMSRLNTTTNIGSGTATSSVPIYMTSTTDSTGNKQAILGSSTTGKQMVWSATGSGPLTNDNVDSLDLSSPDSMASFPFQSNANLKAGQVGQVVSGVDANGNSQYTYYYRGNDNSLNVISDPSVIQSMKKDPVLGHAANNPLFLSPDDVSSMGTTTPFGTPQLQTLDQQAATAAPQAPISHTPNGQSFFSKVGADIAGAASAVGGAVSKFFGNKNRPAAQQTAPESVGGQPSAPDIVAKGQSFFTSQPSTLPPTSQ